MAVSDKGIDAVLGALRWAETDVNQVPTIV